MPRVGQEIEGFGLRLRLLGLAEGLLEMEAEYDGSSGLPPEHFHPHQSERFAVLDGALRVVVNGTERRYVEGDAFEIPAGAQHQIAPDGPARVRWEVRPALRTAEFFERLYGEGPDSLREAESFEAFFDEFADEIRLSGT